MPVDDATAPEWVSKFMETLAGHLAGEDPVHFQMWKHDDEDVWHVEVSPSLFEDAGEVYLREYHVHLTPILALITTPDVIADPDGLSITGTFEDKKIHVVIRTQPEEPDDDAFEVGSKKATETPLPN